MYRSEVMYWPSYRAREELKASESVEMRVIKGRRRVDGLREDQEQAVDDEEEEVEEQEGPKKQEVGEHPGSKASAQFLHGRVPQLEGVEDGEAAEQAVAPSLRGEKHEHVTDADKQKQFAPHHLYSPLTCTLSDDCSMEYFC